MNVKQPSMNLIAGGEDGMLVHRPHLLKRQKKRGGVMFWQQSSIMRWFGHSKSMMETK